MPAPQSSSDSVAGSIASEIESGTAAGLSSAGSGVDSAVTSTDSVGPDGSAGSVPRDDESGRGRRGPVRSGGNDDG